MVSPSKGFFHPDLEGGKGRGVLFRPHRYDTKELMGDVPMYVHYQDYDGRPVSGEIVNLSTTGLAFRASVREVLRNGERLKDFEIRWGDDVVYAGHASVTNQREQDGSLIVGCALKSGLLDTDTLEGFREKARVRSQLNKFRQDFSALYQSKLPVAYKALIADMRLLLERHQQELDELESSYKGLAKHRMTWEQYILECIEPDFAPDFHALVSLLYEQIRHLSGDERIPYRDYAQYHLHSLVMKAPVFQRAYHKPLGYAGDYQVLVWIYFLENHYEGNTVFGKLMQRVGCSTTAGLAGMERIPYLTDKIRQHLVQHTHEQPLRLFSLASGPAKEIQDLLREHPPTQSLHVTLFDQDEEALTYCHDVLTPLQDPVSDHIHIQYLHSSVKQLIRDQTFIESLPKQDLITSTGLFDYLPKRVASQLLNNLVSMLAVGGTAYIGNFQANDTQFVFEYLCDWDLIYRTPQELTELAQAVTMPIQFHIESEKTGNNLFLVVQRKP